MSTRIVAAFFALVFAASTWAQTTAVVGGTVHTMGPEGTIEDATVLIENGTVTRVGENVAVPLKTLGSIGAGDTSALNFEETYKVRMVMGDRRKGERYNVTDAVSGAHKFTKPFDYSGEKTFGDAGATRTTFRV